MDATSQISPTLALLSTDSYSVIIRADALDYESGISRWFRESDGELVFNFKLKKRPWIRGSVLAPDGRPSAGAKVLLVQPGSPCPVVLNLSLTDQWQGERAVASADGHSPFRGQEHNVCFWHTRRKGSPTGSLREMRETAYFASTRGAVRKGAVLVGDHPAPRSPVEAAMDHATAPDGPSYQILFRSRTDERGYFAFGRVPPGPVSVYRPHQFPDAERVRSQSTEIEVRPRTSVELTIGGSGRPLVGRLELVKSIAGLSLTEIEGELVPTEGDNDVKSDRAVPGPSSDATNKRSSPKASASGNHAFDVLADGRFRIDDVVEGHYSLTFTHDTHNLELQSDRTVKPAADGAVFGRSHSKCLKEIAASRSITAL